MRVIFEAERVDIGHAIEHNLAKRAAFGVAQIGPFLEKEFLLDQTLHIDTDSKLYLRRVHRLDAKFDSHVALCLQQLAVLGKRNRAAALSRVEAVAGIGVVQQIDEQNDVSSGQIDFGALLRKEQAVKRRIDDEKLTWATHDCDEYHS